MMFMTVFHQRAIYALSPSLQPDVFAAPIVLNYGSLLYFGLHLAVKPQR